MKATFVSWDDINDEIVAVPTFPVCCIQMGKRRAVNISTTVYVWIYECFLVFLCFNSQNLPLLNRKTKSRKNTINRYINSHRRDLGITSSLFTAGVSLGKFAGTNNKLRWCDYFFAHLLPVHSEKGTLPPPYNTSCRSVSAWRKGFQTEDASLNSELSQSLLLTAPFAVAVQLHGCLRGCKWQVGEQVRYGIGSL